MPPIMQKALLAAAAPLLASGALLRRTGTSSRYFMEEGAVAANSSVKEIQEKWDKMDDFVGIMFEIACKWKHGKDVNGLTAEKLASGELKGGDATKFKMKTQERNVQELKQACGRIVAANKGKCRQSCADRWGVEKGSRAACDAKCVTNFATFEAQCLEKAEHLKMVYTTKLNRAAARTTCNEGHCPLFPTVWMSETEPEMKAEADKQCSSQCTEDQIKVKCQHKWLLEVDFLRPSIRSACFEEGKASICFNEKKGPASTAYDMCMTDGGSTCDTQATTCNSEGKTDATFKDAKAFCDSRKKMCKEQVTEHCHKDYTTALDTAKKECEEADKQSLNDCETTQLGQKETEEASKCLSEMTPKCSDECHAKCNTVALHECLSNLKTDNDATELFCKDFWHLLHESSELDTATGDPSLPLALKARQN